MDDTEVEMMQNGNVQEPKPEIPDTEPKIPDTDSMEPDTEPNIPDKESLITDTEMKVPDNEPVVADPDAYLHASLKIGNYSYSVSLSESCLSWIKKGDTPDQKVAVPIDEIVSISKITGRADEGGFEVVGFTVCYIEHLKNFQLRRAMTQFLSSPEEGEEWSKNLQEALDMGCTFSQAHLSLRPGSEISCAGSNNDLYIVYKNSGCCGEAAPATMAHLVEHRPRNALVLVHPLSGNRSGKIYNETVSAVFRQANIETNVIVTDRTNNCKEVLSSYDLTKIDSIVLVGGDGFYHEAVNTLELKVMEEKGLDENVPEIDLQQIPLPIGIVPAGTDNTVAMNCYGCTDIETAALTIMKGQRLPSSLVSVHSQDELVGYGGIFVGYGIWADAIHYSLTRRHLEALRYHFSYIEALLIRSHRQMNLSIEHLPPLTTEEREKVQDSQVEDGWRSKQGTYTGVMMYVNDRFVDPEELEPLDDHCTRLVLNKPGGRIQLTRFLYKYRSQDPTTLSNDNIEHMLTKEFKVILNNPSDADSDYGKKEHMIDIDGEIFTLKDPQFLVRLHPEVVQLFSSSKDTLLWKQKRDD